MRQGLKIVFLLMIILTLASCGGTGTGGGETSQEGILTSAVNMPSANNETPVLPGSAGVAPIVVPESGDMAQNPDPLFPFFAACFSEVSPTWCAENCSAEFLVDMYQQENLEAIESECFYNCYEPQLLPIDVSGEEGDPETYYCTVSVPDWTTEFPIVHTYCEKRSPIKDPCTWITYYVN